MVRESVVGVSLGGGRGLRLYWCQGPPPSRQSFHRLPLVQAPPPGANHAPLVQHPQTLCTRACSWLKQSKRRKKERPRLFLFFGGGGWGVEKGPGAVLPISVLFSPIFTTGPWGVKAPRGRRGGGGHFGWCGFGSEGGAFLPPPPSSKAPNSLCTKIRLFFPQSGDQRKKKEREKQMP